MPQFTLPGGSRYQGNSTNPPWAYNWTTNGGVVEPTIDHVDYDSPSSIDITFTLSRPTSLGELDVRGPRIVQ